MKLEGTRWPWPWPLLTAVLLQFPDVTWPIILVTFPWRNSIIKLKACKNYKHFTISLSTVMITNFNSSTRNWKKREISRLICTVTRLVGSLMTQDRGSSQVGITGPRTLPRWSWNVRAVWRAAKVQVNSSAGIVERLAFPPPRRCCHIDLAPGLLFIPQTSVSISQKFTFISSLSLSLSYCQLQYCTKLTAPVHYFKFPF